MIEIKAPMFPESIADGEIAEWHVEVGESVKRDQVIVDIETDKVVLEVAAVADGKVTEILKQQGETVLAEEVLALFEEGEVSDAPAAKSAAQAEPAPESEAAPTPAPTTPAPAPTPTSTPAATPQSEVVTGGDAIASPAARKIAKENEIKLSAMQGTGKGGRITREDVMKVVSQAPGPAQPAKRPAEPAAVPEPTTPTFADTPKGRVERRVPMTRLRASIARRLVEAQQTAAMLTTFNEVDMKGIMDLRARYKEDFQKAHDGTRLGFMSFFVRACIESLKRFPAVNASIDENDIVYHGYQDIGVAVSSPRGLVVPVMRDADNLSLAEIEEQIRALSTKARDNKLAIEDISGGTFTISNGGVFGSLLSTPILNPPQTAILGMHKIQERPMVMDGEIQIRPMMYLALSYDHRVIDGSEAVRFLVTIKEFLEEPARIMLDI